MQALYYWVVNRTGSFRLGLAFQDRLTVNRLTDNIPTIHTFNLLTRAVISLNTLSRLESSRASVPGSNLVSENFLLIVP